MVQKIAGTGSSLDPPKWPSYGAETTVPDWSKRLVCSQCGSRNVDFVVSGTKRNPRSSG
jgi:hypothetical protein